MGQIFYSVAGIIILLLALWFISALYRVWRSPETVLKRWKKLNAEDLKQLSLLCELFFKEELHLQLNKENLRNSIPALLQIFPHGNCRLQGYLLLGTGKEQSPGSRLFSAECCRRTGKYFYGFTSLLLSSFIGESLRCSCGGEWIPGPCGLQLHLPGGGRENPLTISPVEKLASLNNISTRRDKELFEEYLLELCVLSTPPRNI